MGAAPFALRSPSISGTAAVFDPLPPSEITLLHTLHCSPPSDPLPIVPLSTVRRLLPPPTCRCLLFPTHCASLHWCAPSVHSNPDDRAIGGDSLFDESFHVNGISCVVPGLSQSEKRDVLAPSHAFESLRMPSHIFACLLMPSHTFECLCVPSIYSHAFLHLSIPSNVFTRLPISLHAFDCLPHDLPISPRGFSPLLLMIANASISSHTFPCAVSQLPHAFSRLCMLP